MNRRNFIVTSFAVMSSATIGQSALAAEAEYTWIYITDMHCGACAKKIARKLYTVPGVVKVQTSLKENFAVITPQAGKSISPKAVWEAVQSVEFTPVKLQCPEGVYTSKPRA